MFMLDKALKDAKASLLEVREVIKTWEAQYASIEKKLRAERATCSTFKVRTSASYFFRLQHSCTDWVISMFRST